MYALIPTYQDRGPQLCNIFYIVASTSLWPCWPWKSRKICHEFQASPVPLLTSGFVSNIVELEVEVNMIFDQGSRYVLMYFFCRILCMNLAAVADR